MMFTTADLSFFAQAVTMTVAFFGGGFFGSRIAAVVYHRKMENRFHWKNILIALTGSAIATVIMFNEPLLFSAIAKILGALVLLAILVNDLETWIIPTVLPLLLIILGFVLGMFAPAGDLVGRLIGAAAGFGVLAFLLLGSTWLFRQTGRLRADEWAMGWGDPILMVGIGAILGYRPLVIVLWLASLQAVAAHTMLRLWRRDFVRLAKESHESQKFLPPRLSLPLGTFLCLAAIEIIVAAGFFR